MWLMTGFAGNAVRVIRRINLRKPLGLGGTRRVASCAQHRGIRFHRRYRRRIVRVLGQRPVAGLAVHMRMLALAFHIEDVGVAGFACLVTGKFHRAGRDFADCGAAIVPVLPETRRNHEMSNHKEDDEGENKESRESE